ncbi:MAG: hypothetical protein SO412_07670 [Erysipelotrichaceae bacterium]|nr:hypothetical protein [Erysipelotrichaceae bacterium]
MKKLLVLSFLTFACMGLCSCGGEKEASESSTSSKTSSSEKSSEQSSEKSSYKTTSEFHF